MMKHITFVKDVILEEVPVVGYRDVLDYRMYDQSPIFNPDMEFTETVAITERKCNIVRFSEVVEGVHREWLIAHSPVIDEYVLKPLSILDNELSYARSEITKMQREMYRTGETFWTRLKFLFTGRYVG